MATKPYRDESRRNYFESIADKPTLEQINTGCLQRIADATEKIAARYEEMREDRDRYKRWYEERKSFHEREMKRTAALRGIVKKLKSQASVAARG